MPETAPVRRRLPTTAPRRGQTRGGPGRTPGGGSIVQRGQLKPRTLTLRTSHFPDPPAATIQLNNTTALDTERRRLDARTYFLDGITVTTISVKMLKISPRMPQPNGLRPFIPAITAQIIAAITLPMATKMPLMPRRINPAASGWLYAASINW